MVVLICMIIGRGFELQVKEVVGLSIDRLILKPLKLVVTGSLQSIQQIGDIVTLVSSGVEQCVPVDRHAYLLVC